MSQQMTDRLAASAEQITMALEHLGTERDLRNDIVMDARREGMSYGQIAHAAGLTRCRIVHIVAENA